MYRPTSTRSLRSKNRILQVLLSILAVSVALFGGNSFTGFAMPPNPIEPPPIGNPPPWQAPADGFGWSVPSRFGNDMNGDGMIDYHYNQTTMLYEPSHIYPAYWPMDFNGCQTEGDADTPTATTNTYHWALNGQTLTGNVCRFTYKPGLSIGGVALTGFPAQGTYHVTLSVTDPSGNPVPAGRTTPFEQDVYIRDYLIVSLGDSIASGEGNPDRPQVYDPPTWYWPFYNLITPAKWQDERCHRSANAGAAQAALALEASDRKTSVTFISFACSGATVRAQLYDNPYDSNTPRGSGLLGPYRGQQVPDGFPYDFSQYIPSQISQLTTALTPPAGMTARQMDALILTAGGNDMHFGDIATACLFADDCWNDGTAFNESPNNGPYDLRTLVFRTLGMAGENSSVYRLDSSFELLDQQIDALNPAHVYITEYPDQTRDDNGFYCRMLDDIFWPLDLAITESEAQDSAQIALTNLNDTVRLAASLNGWQYVDGITSYSVDTEVEAGTPGPFVRDSAGKGHGYCASDNWIRRADEAELIQGPFLRFATKGTLHPTLRGTEVYKQRILRYLLPNLGIGATNTAPTFSASFSNGTLTNVSGANGWTVQSCAGATCYPKAVLNVTASDDTAIQGASIAVNGASGCALGGVTCSAPVPSTDGKQVTWSIEITAEGAYTFQFTAQDNSNQTATFSQQIKTDFQNPAFDSEAEALSVNEGDTLALDAPVFDPSGGPLALEWDIDQNGSFETAGDTPAFSAANIDGPALISIPVRATDQAGRAATGQVAINVQNVAPTAAIGGVPASSPEGTPVTLAGSFTDPAPADTASYAWSVTKNGQPFTTGSGASFSFTPDDNGSYGVTLAVTDDDGGVGSASATVLVTNVAPTPAFIDPPATIPEGSELCVYASVTDPGSADTMASYAWSMVKNGAALPSSDMAPSSMAGGVCYYPRDNGVYTIKLVATDDDGGVGTASVDIDVTNVAPRVGMTDVPAGQVEGRLLALIGNVIDPGTEDTFTYDWNVTKNGSAFATGSERILTFTPDDNGSYVVSLDVTDDDGGTGSATSQTIQVANLAPTVSNLETSATTIQEGDSILFTGVVADASAADTFTVTIDWGDGSDDTVLSLAAGATGFSTNHTYADDNPSGTASDLNTISVSVEDDDHGTGSASTTLTVENTAPVAAITAPAESTVYALGSAVSLQLAYTDANASDGHTYTIDWDDGVVDTGSLAGGSFSTSHQYAAAGVYTVQATVADDDTGSDTKTVMVVVYDPTSGYVTGAGRIYSPAGAYVADPTLEGMAQFAFVSKYRRGANVPDGNTEFQFQAGQFRFRSDSYDWLVVAGARAQFKGNGSVNGVSGYTFLLTAVDGDLNGGGGIDKFRIKIWDASGVVYDNVLGASDDLEGANPQEITSGTIMIRNN